MKNSLKQIFTIYTSDIKNIATNWVAIVLIGGLVFLPSLYAWFNIYASWDPYGQTNQMQVAIVNEDAGSTVRGDAINVGNELVVQLSTNQNFAWKFTNREEAINQVTVGDYFAAVIIPADFSTKLASVLADTPEKAKIEYYVNEKINSIAPKITDKGASGIAEQISSEFIATVNGTIFTLFNELGIEIEKEIPNFEKFEEYVFLIEEHLPEIEHTLNKAAQDSDKAGEMITEGLDMMPQVQETTNQGLATVQSAQLLLNEAEVTLNNLSPIVERDLQRVQKISRDVESFLAQLGNVNIDTPKLDQALSDLQNQLAIAEKGVDELITHAEAVGEIAQDAEATRLVLKEKVQQTINELLAMNPQIDEEKLANSKMVQKLEDILTHVDSLPNAQEREQLVLNRLNNLKSVMSDFSRQLDALGQIDVNDSTVKQGLKNLQQVASNIDLQIDGFLTQYKNTLEPKIKSMLGDAKESLTGASDILTKVQGLVPEVTQILKDADESLAKANETLAKIQADYPSLSEKVNELADKLRTLNKEANIHEIITLLKNNASAERDFFANPVEIENHKLFPIEKYGTGMIPFYTVLSIWVGCLLLISLLSVNIHHAGQYTIREVYFGRLLTFGTFALLQTFIITMGDIFLFDGTLASPVLFVVFGLFISSVFITVVYTLVSVFGDVGKAMAIVMLVLQIAGSGGTYPVQLLPKFFQMINPFLPFTYAIELMREAVGGIIWSTVMLDIAVLLVGGVLFLLFGTFFKKILSEKTEALLKKSRETDIIH
ncbi:YhgE/Pip domain-containing protein [Metasolibacillus meyeri]|uniref:YhgE/Pip domain-containing protein n=1 Tax=Metasolibacillus meyeri TaxID=1071052 RepID=UPI000D30EF34|nr:YhgE/Pip domain-containing protein [Metasolibacillus meyeri]